MKFILPILAVAFLAGGGFPESQERHRYRIIDLPWHGEETHNYPPDPFPALSGPRAPGPGRRGFNFTLFRLWHRWWAESPLVMVSGWITAACERRCPSANWTDSSLASVFALLIAHLFHSSLFMMNPS
ncbi:hypothetical protein BDK51DRAFT_29750 [Blyttiomyces helicus]|uniref:Uncharacterized protein n=1 Tax=Blyttiomyces helicus TaxID=388810 RepID=A0A4P9WE40_9FUNG|nr:hypothetical protein BDK51DRAFT_29750 [Blyttiomyces helicus]|eukprot:RKO89953.1 hypothetical protein BDK51DRAFT_29750 [Blyttiomyces helicus]